MDVIDNVKEVADLVKNVGDIELYRKIVHLEGQVIELTRRLRALEEENSELKQTLQFNGKLKFRQPYYYADGDVVPYCPRCWEVDKSAVHMVHQFTNSENTRYDCPQCKSTVMQRHGGRERHGMDYSIGGGPDGWMR